MGINRTTAGIIDSDDFNRSDGAPGSGWDVQNGTVEIVSNKLRVSSNAGRVRSAAANRNEAVAQWSVCVNAGAAGGPIFRVQDDGDCYYLQFNSLSVVTLFRLAPPSSYAALTTSAGFSYTATVPFPVKAYWKDGVQKTWIGADGSVTRDATNTALDADGGTAGAHLNNTGNVEIDDYYLFRNNKVVVSNLPPGWKARIGSLVEEESSGTATIDLGKMLYPLPDLEILDDTDTLIETWDSDTHGPVAPGDEFEVTTDFPPDKPSIVDVGEITQNSAQITGSAYSNPGSLAHQATRVQVALRSDSGFTNPVVDDVVGAITVHTVTGLPSQAELVVRIAYQASNDQWSQWSDPAEFNTKAAAYPALQRTTRGYIAGPLAESSASAASLDFRKLMVDGPLPDAAVVQSLVTVATEHASSIAATSIGIRFASTSVFYYFQVQGPHPGTHVGQGRFLGPGTNDRIHFDVVGPNWPFPIGTPYPMKQQLFPDTNKLRGWLGSDAFPFGPGFFETAELTDADLLPTAGAGLRANHPLTSPPAVTSAVWTDYYVYAANTLRCTGLQQGDNFRAVNADNSIAFNAIANISGVAEDSLGGAYCPFLRVEVIRAGVVIASLEPDGGVFGGDEYAFQAVDPDIPPPVQRRTFERAWAFVLDGHVFYVLNQILDSSLLYDAITGQWCRWFGHEGITDTTMPFWNMWRGHVWKGRVLAADFERPIIWEMDPHSHLDEEEFVAPRRVTGYLPLRGSGSMRQGALRIIARKEDAAAPATLRLRVSDDNGKTWRDSAPVVLAPSSYSQRVEFRSLGRIRAPGRVFEIEDEGFARIEGADADLEGVE